VFMDTPERFIVGRALQGKYGGWLERPPPPATLRHSITLRDVRTEGYRPTRAYGSVPRLGRLRK